MSQLLNPGRQYSAIKFPEYQYREYPKWVKRQDGSSVLVQDKSEELRVITESVENAKEPSALEQERDALAKQVAELQARLNLATAPKPQVAAAAAPKVTPAK